MGSMVLALLLALSSVVVDGQSYQIDRKPTTATASNESGNNRYPMSGAKREMITVSRDGAVVWRYICVDECQRWSDVQLVRRALTLRSRAGRKQ